MFLDWISREGGAVISWWLLSLLASWAVFPLCYRLLHGLSGRGYALSRAAGLLLIGFAVWLPNNFGMLNNSPGATVFAWLIVLILSLISYFSWSEREPILVWAKRNLGYIVATEALFAMLFLGWATYRSLYNQITATEKPMEMAFLSASRRSASFPPNDPWFSGYAISYYHFGYILIALIANLTGVTNGMAFNLGIALLFALAGTGAFGVAYELVAARRGHASASRMGDSGDESGFARWKIGIILVVFFAGLIFDTWYGTRGVVLAAATVCAVMLLIAMVFNRLSAPIMTGVLAAVFTVFMGNLGTGLVELPYQTRSAPEAYLNFMAIESRESNTGVSPINAARTDCSPSGSTNPLTWCNWWWFRWSRVIRDLDLGGLPTGNQPISEFPSFSFVLSDMHPHVLSMPFFILNVGLALNLVLGRRRLKPWEFLIYAIAAGGMIFLNSWDAVLLLLIIGAEALRRLINNGTGWFTREDWFGIGIFAALLVGAIALLYLPFFIGFRSQAGGILPNAAWQTQFQQFFLMFGTFLVILVSFLIAEVVRAGKRLNVGFALQVIVGIGATGLVAMVALLVIAWNRAEVQQIVYQVIDQSGGIGSALAQVLSRRALGIVTQLFLVGVLFVIVARLFPREPRRRDGTPGQADAIITYNPTNGFILLLIALGALLTLAPDFVYLRDGFLTRINTIFKFYYQAWLFWAIASAYAVWSILNEITLRNGKEWQVPFAARLAFTMVCAVLVMLGLLYPPAAVASRAFLESGRVYAEGQGNTLPMTLDGGLSMVNFNADEYAVIQCLAKVATSDKDVVAEATRRGLAYNGSWGRVSALTGIPTLLGWDNHEGQWRGDTFSQFNVIQYLGADGISRSETRYDAIATLYNTENWAEAKGVIDRYGITYIYIGSTERNGEFSTNGLAKFKSLPAVCSSGDVAVYAASSIGTKTSANK